MTVTKPPLLLGHRGDRRSAPENTIAAFELAMANGCDGFEFDVRLTLDLESIVCHDPDFLGLPVSATKLGALQRKLDTLRTLDESLPRLPSEIASLKDVFVRYAGTAFLDVELKVSGLESAIFACLSEHPPQRGYVVSSFLPDVLRKMRWHARDVQLGFICDSPRMLPLWRELPAEYVIPKYDLATPGLIDEVHQAGRKILVWTVNDAATMLYFAKLAVDGIMSDDSRLLVQTLKGPEW